MPVFPLKMIRFSVLLMIAYLPFILLAQNVQNIKINNYPVSFHKEIVSWAALNVRPQTNNREVVLLQFNKLLTEADRKILDASLVRVQEYMGSNTYSALVSANTDFAVLENMGSIAGYLPAYKIAPSIQIKAARDKTVTILVSFFQEIKIGDIMQNIEAHGGTILPNNWQDKGLYKIQITSVQLNSFAAFYGVKYISEPAQNISLDLDSKGGAAATRLNIPVFLGGKGLQGKGVMIGHGDNCSGIYHIDQADRTINYNTADKADHGVLVHGIIAGDGIMDPAGQGVAPDGTCISLYFDAVLALKDELYTGFNVTLTNNSYASVVGDCSYSGTYDNLSQNLDEMAYHLPEQLDVFAVGNDGRSGCGGYPAGYANVCGGYQAAKNVLTVGATSRDYVIGDGSSRGPLKDGRLKPEITASGIDILCPVPDNSYTITRGTSLSCPQVTGVLALLTERYRQLNSNKNPKSDLLKAIAINGASDLGRPGPDFLYGFGFLNAERSMGILENNQYLRNTLSTGEPPKSFTITVPANTAQLKVLLYYHDPVASAASVTQLINDLDLTVTEPGGTVVHRPLILNPSITGVGNNAVEGIDRLNNVEQVTINNPVAGIYTVTVAGFAIPLGEQSYVVVYDKVPDEMKLMFPVANTAAPAGSDLYVYWDAPADNVNMTKVEFTANNGISWTTLESAVPANTRYYKWAVPSSINSSQCKIRISRTGKSAVSGSFIINEQPVISLSTDQCPGSFAINWSIVPSADKYYMMLKKGAHFQKIDSVNAGVTSYNFTSLNTGTDYYVAVLPAIGGMEGYRSKAVTRKPNSGSCLSVLHGDLAMSTVTSPETGRKFTQSELRSNTEIKVTVRNQDIYPVSDFSISYKVNAGIWKTIPGFAISAQSESEQIVDTFDFSDTIAYTLTLVVNNNDRIDPVTANDTIIKVLRHIPNEPVSLLSRLSNDFEDFPDFTIMSDTLGLDGTGFWDYNNSSDTGRLRSRIPGSRLVKTKRSISMDVNMKAKETVNYFTGTFNFSNYDTTADELRFDFEYEMRGMPLLKDSNKVWVRGSDTEDWIEAFTYKSGPGAGVLRESGTLSLRDLLRNKGQNFSSATQVRFTQFDSTLIVNDNVGAGLTVDNVNFYKVSKDLQLREIMAPFTSECDLSASPVVIKMKNGTNSAIKGVTLGYTFDGGKPEIEVFDDIIKGNDSVIYSFSKQLSGLTFGTHKLNVWLHTEGDDFLKNDTIKGYEFYNSDLISKFPYLENFETTSGGWYVSGHNASWACGIPASEKINKAASGQKAWKTNLTGNYNPGETSYLISPCINTMELANPMLSFSTIFELERCVTGMCDRVFIEYSTDHEVTWTKLGVAGTGTNWYTDSLKNVWNGQQLRWHVASASLPRSPQLKLRFVLLTDDVVNKEGFAVDDIHIYDLQQQIIDMAVNDRKSAENKELHNNEWTYFTDHNKVIAAINLYEEYKGTISSTVFGHQKYTDMVNRQYYLPRSWVIHSENALREVQSLFRLFVTDAEVNKVSNDTSCSTCTKAEDIYRTGITQYNGGKTEDSSLQNNVGGAYAYYRYNKVQWVPYDNGYYAEFAPKGLGEFWLNDGGILGTLPLNTEYITLNVQKITGQQALLNWVCSIDTQMNTFQAERSFDNITFTPVHTIVSQKSVLQHYSCTDNPDPSEGATVYYRILCTAVNGKTFYSNADTVQWTKGDQLLGVYPVPSGDGRVTVHWTGDIGNIVRYSITDITGKMLFQDQFISTSWTNNSTLNLNFLAKGMYFLKLQIGNNQYQEKLIFK